MSQENTQKATTNEHESTAVAFDLGGDANSQEPAQEEVVMTEREKLEAAAESTEEAKAEALKAEEEIEEDQYLKRGLSRVCDGFTMPPADQKQSSLIMMPIDRAIYLYKNKGAKKAHEALETAANDIFKINDNITSAHKQFTAINTDLREAVGGDDEKYNKLISDIKDKGFTAAVSQIDNDALRHRLESNYQTVQAQYASFDGGADAVNKQIMQHEDLNMRGSELREHLMQMKHDGGFYIDQASGNEIHVDFKKYNLDQILEYEMNANPQGEVAQLYRASEHSESPIETFNQEHLKSSMQTYMEMTEDYTKAISKVSSNYTGGMNELTQSITDDIMAKNITSGEKNKDLEESVKKLMDGMKRLLASIGLKL